MQSTFLEIIHSFNNYTLSIADSIMAITLSFILALMITQIYKITYRGIRYSQSFVHTIIIMSVVVSVVMAVIGNNIAVAFGLVGAFSIIRFRSAMNDPKDIAFIFFGMVSGIACGLGFYLLAVVFTITVSIFIYILFLFNYGKQNSTEKTLKITVPENLHYEGLFEDIFNSKLDFFQLLSVQTTNLGTMIQLEYTILSKDTSTDKDLIDAIRERNANLKVSIQMSRINY